MAVKLEVELDCEKLREQLRELIKEIVEDVARNGPVVNIANHNSLSPNAEGIARDIAQLINGNNSYQNHR